MPARFPSYFTGSSAALLVLLAASGATGGEVQPTAVNAPTAITARPEPPELASLRLKAERGNSIAQYNLGLAYAQGRDTPVDLIEAFVWLTLSSESGSTGKALDGVLGSMTAAQINEGRRRLDLLRARAPGLAPPAQAAVPTPAIIASGDLSLSSPTTATSGAPDTLGRGPVDVPSAATADPRMAAVDSRSMFTPPAANDDETRRLTVELAAARQEAGRLQAEVSAIRSRAAAEAAVRTADSAAELAGARSELREAQASLAEQSRELAALRAEAAVARIELAKLGPQLAALREDAAARAAASDEADALRALLERERAAWAERESAQAVQNAEAAREAENVAALRRQLAALEAERAAFAAEKTRLAATSAETTLEARKASEAVALAAELRRELAGVRRRAEELESTLARTIAEHTQVERTRLESAARAEQQVASLRTQFEGAEARLASAQAELISRNQEISRLRTTLESGAQDSERLKRSQAETLARVTSEKEELTRRLATAERATARADEAGRRAAALAHDLENAQRELGELRKTNAEAVVQRSRLEREIEALAKAKQESEDRQNIARAEDGKLRASLAAAERLAGSASTALAAAEAKALSHAAELSELRRELSALEAARAKASAEQAALRAATQEAEARAAAAAEAAARLETVTRDQAAEARALNERLRRLETENTALATQASASADMQEQIARSAASRTEAEERLATALRSFTLLTNERDELAARLAAEQARPVSQPTPDPATLAELEVLRNRVVSAERTAAAAQVEIARLGNLRSGTGTADPPRPAVVSNQPIRPGPAPGAPTPVALPPDSTPTSRIHVISAGETLSGISRRYYGTPSRWAEIFEANRDVLRDERSLVAGRTLRIP